MLTSVMCQRQSAHLHFVRQEARIDSRGTTTESNDELDRDRVQLDFNPVCNDAQAYVHRLAVDVAPTTSVRDLTNTLAKMSGHEMEKMELRYCGKILHPNQALKDCISRSGETLQLTKKDPPSDGHAKDIVHNVEPPQNQQD